MPGAIVKICGLQDEVSLQAAVEAGTRYIGFNFIERSNRFVTPERAAELALAVPAGVAKVGLTLDANNDELDALVAKVPLDFIQLHGAEIADRVQEVRARFGLPVIKAVGVADESDLAQLEHFEHVADQLLVDTKKPAGADLPGGNGMAFDWTLIAQRKWACPWLLAGGLTVENVAEAIRCTGALQVDVASGVESAPGVKDAEKIRAFVNAAQGR